MNRGLKSAPTVQLETDHSRWQQLSLTCAVEQAEHLAGLLELAGPESLGVPVAMESECRLQALFTADRDLGGLQCLLVDAGAGEVDIVLLPEQDWLALSRDHWRPMPVGGGVWVGPGWCAPPAGARLYVRIDPGRAFGTGGHATTRLCLRWLVEQSVLQDTVVDYGCGSGILAITAALLGAAEVTAADIDPLCLAATADNAAANGVADRVRVLAAGELAGPPVRLLMANMLLRPLLVLAPRLADLVAGRGHIVLSGIMPDQVDDCRAAYAPWFDFSAPCFEDEWALLCGRRRDLA